MKTFLHRVRGQVTRPKIGHGPLHHADMSTTFGTILFSSNQNNPLSIRVMIHTNRFGLQEFTLAREILVHPIKEDVVNTAPSHVFELDKDVSFLFNLDGHETLVVISKRDWTKLVKRLNKRLPESLVNDAVDKFVEGLGL